MLMVDKLTAIPEFPWVGQLNFSNIDIDGALFSYGRYKDDKAFCFYDVSEFRFIR